MHDDFVKYKNFGKRKIIS